MERKPDFRKENGDIAQTVNVVPWDAALSGSRCLGRTGPGGSEARITTAGKPDKGSGSRSNLAEAHNMIYSIGVDIGVDEFHAAVIDESCKPVASKHFPCEESGFASFMAWVDGLVGPVHELCLCIEACGVLHLNLVFWLREHRPEVSVYVVNALAAKRYGGAKLRRNHTDPADAFHLGVMVARSRDELHVFTVEPAHRQVQRLVLERGQIARDIVRQTNRLHAALVVNFPEYSRVMRKVDQALSLELLSRFPTAQSVAKAGIKRLSQIRPNAKGCHALGEKRAHREWRANARPKVCLAGTEEKR